MITGSVGASLSVGILIDTAVLLATGTSIISSLGIVAIGAFIGCIAGVIPEITDGAESLRERCCRPRY